MNTVQKSQSIWLTATLCFIVMLGPMNAVLFNVALENISKDLAISTAEVSWIVVGYSLVVGVGSMIYGKLADSFSLKKLLIISIYLFILGSITGFIFQSFIAIVLSRLLQASGGAAFIALSMVTVARIYSLEDRPRVLAMLSSSIALAIGIGPLVGGAITNSLGWPFLFIFMTISAIGILLLKRFMPTETIIKNKALTFDFIGALLLFLMVASLLLGISFNLWFFVATFVLFILFKHRINQTAFPIIDIELFENSPYLRLITIGFIMNVALCANLLLIPLLLSHEYSFSPFTIGGLMFIASIFGIFSSFFTGNIISRLGNIKVIHIATLAMILGFVILGIFPGQNIVINLIAMILIFMGYSSIQVALNNFIPKMLNPIKIGVGLGLYNLTNFVGMAFGPALASKIIEVTNNLSYVFLLMAIFLVGHIILTFHFPVSQNKD